VKEKDEKKKKEKGTIYNEQKLFKVRRGLDPPLNNNFIILVIFSRVL
jgi:hypothetical protein